MDFVETVRKSRVKQPVQQGYDETKWEQAYQQAEKNKRSEKLFQSGIIVGKLLENIRATATKVAYPEISDNQILPNIAAFINHQYFAALSKINGKVGDTDVVSTNSLVEARVETEHGTNFDIDGLVSSLVDFARYEISQVMKGIAPKNKTQVYMDSAVANRMMVVSAYNFFETIWSKILWQDFYLDFTGENEVTIERELDSYIKMSTVGLHRHLMIQSEMTQRSFMSWKKLPKEIREELSLNHVKRISRKNGLYSIKDFSTDLLEAPSLALINGLYGEEMYWNDLLDLELPKLQKLTIRKILKMWTVICSFLEVIKESRIETLNDNATLLDFSIVLDKENLIEKISEELKFKKGQVRAFIDSLIFDGNVRNDLWFYPFLKGPNGALITILPSILAGNLVRYIETWLHEGGISLDKRGNLFEKYVHEICLKDISKSKLKGTKLLPPCIYEYNGNKEEIDHIWILENTIFIADSKCSLYPITGLEWYNYTSTLEGGAKQLLRKIEFLKANLKEFCTEYELEFNGEVQFVPIVISNFVLLSGYAFGEVTVTDLFNLSKFISGEEKLFAITGPGVTEFKSKKTVKLYSSTAEASEKIKSYFKSGPSLDILTDSVKEFKNHFQLPWLPELHFYMRETSVQIDPSILKSNIPEMTAPVKMSEKNHEKN